MVRRRGNILCMITYKTIERSYYRVKIIIKNIMLFISLQHDGYMDFSSEWEFPVLNSTLISKEKGKEKQRVHV